MHIRNTTAPATAAPVWATGGAGCERVAKGSRAFQRILSTEGRGVRLWWEHEKPEGPQGKVVVCRSLAAWERQGGLPRHHRQRGEAGGSRTDDASGRRSDAAGARIGIRRCRLDNSIAVLVQDDDPHCRSLHHRRLGQPLHAETVSAADTENRTQHNA